MTDESTLPDRLLRIGEVKKLVGLGKTKIYGLVAEGKFPRPFKLTPKAARWSERQVHEWIERMQRVDG